MQDTTPKTTMHARLDTLPNLVFHTILKNLQGGDIHRLVQTHNHNIQSKVQKNLTTDNMIRTCGTKLLFWSIQTHHHNILKELINKNPTLIHATWHRKKPLSVAIADHNIPAALLLRSMQVPAQGKKPHLRSLAKLARREGYFNWRFAFTLAKTAYTHVNNLEARRELKRAETFAADQANTFNCHHDTFLFLKLARRNPQYVHNPVQLIRKALDNYSKASWGGPRLAALGRFFSGRWNNHYGKLVASLLLQPEYAIENFKNIKVLKTFMATLTIGIQQLGKINPEGETYRILSLASQIAQNDFTHGLSLREKEKPSPTYHDNVDYYGHYNPAYRLPLGFRPFMHI